jgi:hypothetical protein
MRGPLVPSPLPTPKRLRPLSDALALTAGDYDRWGPTATQAILDLILQHPDAILATYV